MSVHRPGPLPQGSPPASSRPPRIIPTEGRTHLVGVRVVLDRGRGARARLEQLTVEASTSAPARVIFTRRLTRRDEDTQASEGGQP